MDYLVFFKTYRTIGLRVRNNPLTNIPKGFGSEMTLEVAEGRLQVAGLCMLEGLNQKIEFWQLLDSFQRLEILICSSQYHPVYEDLWFLAIFLVSHSLLPSHFSSRQKLITCIISSCGECLCQSFSPIFCVDIDSLGKVEIDGVAARFGFGKSERSLQFLWGNVQEFILNLKS